MNPIFSCFSGFKCTYRIHQHTQVILKQTFNVIIRQNPLKEDFGLTGNGKLILKYTSRPQEKLGLKNLLFHTMRKSTLVTRTKAQIFHNYILLAVLVQGLVSTAFILK